MNKFKLLLATLLTAISVHISWAQSPLPTSGKVYNIRFVSNQATPKNVYVYMNGTSLALTETAPTASDTNYQWYITETGTANIYHVQNVANGSYYLKIDGLNTTVATTPQNVKIYEADWVSQSMWNNSDSKKTPTQNMIASSLYIGRSDDRAGSTVVWQTAGGADTWAFNQMDGGYDTGWGTANRVLTSQVLMDVAGDYYYATYKDESSNALNGVKAYVNSGSSTIGGGLNRIKCGSEISKFVGEDLHTRNFLSATIEGGATYDNLTDFLDNVQATDNVVITLGQTNPLPVGGNVYNIRFVSNQDPQKHVYVYMNGTSLALTETAPTASDTNYQWYITETATANYYYVQNVANDSYYLKINGSSSTVVTTPQNVKIYDAAGVSATSWNTGDTTTPTQDKLASSLYIGRESGTGSTVAYQTGANSPSWAFNQMSAWYDAGWGTADRVLTSQVLMDGVAGDFFHVTYQDESSAALTGARAIASTGQSFICDGANHIAPGTTIRDFVGQDFLVRNFVSATIGETTYNTLDALLAAVQANDNVVITLAQPIKLTGKCFAIRHAGNAYNNTNNHIGEASDKKLYRGVHAPNTSLKTVFTFEDAGDGKFYIRNLATGNYVMRPGKIAQDNAAAPTTADVSVENCAYRITNGLVAGRHDVFAFADAKEVPNPIVNHSIRRYLFAKIQDYTNIVRWSAETTFEQGAETSNAHWYIEEIPVIELTFKDTDGNDIIDPEYNATFSYSGLPDNTVLACFKGIYFSLYAVVNYELNGITYSTRTQFFEACHNLTENGQAVLTLRTKDPNEVDLTIQLWKTKGKGYTSADCDDVNVTGIVDFTDAANAHSPSMLKAWKLVVSSGDTDIKGAPIPTDLDFRIVSTTTDNGVGGAISNSTYETYHYGQVSSAPDCLCFYAALDGGNDYEFRVASTAADSEYTRYYILQYNMGINSGTAHQTLVLKNDGGATVTTGNPASGQQRYTITDTPAAATTSFNAVAKTEGQAMEMAANYFRVRIVNETYLLNSMDRGYAICSAALYSSSEGNLVGYPKTGTQAYYNLSQAISQYDGSLSKYIAMLQAYSEYISCTDLNMPEDCQVYTLSFIKSDGTRALINNNLGTLEVVDYTDANKMKHSARWISHSSGEGDAQRLLLVNKEDGRYLKVGNTATITTSETYDDGTCSFITTAVTQNMTDYMASATDEKLLGAVCMKNAAGNHMITIRNSDNTFVKNSAANFNDNYSSALLMELVYGGDTYNSVAFRKAGDLYYATYYGFYPVENPYDADMYYVADTQVRDEETYLQLKEVEEDVIRPEFPVILISDNKLLYEDDDEEATHLHIGKYTSTKKTHIESLLTENPNMLKGTLDDIETSTVEGDVYVLSGKVKDGVTVPGFYKYTGAFLPKGKAYYEVASGGSMSGIRGFLFSFKGTTTTIDLNPGTDNADKAVIYDLCGRRVKSADNGLFIINGKKVVK